MVDWRGAQAYAAWEAARTGQPWRLPGELEWEKAARGVDGRAFPWGDGFDPSWTAMRQSAPGRSLPVEAGTRPVDESPYGVRDMGGNAADWCAEPFSEGGPELGEGGRGLPGDPRWARDPSVTRVVRRGGSWDGSWNRLRVANRNSDLKTTRCYFASFRLARSWG
ncbi:MAG: SUMF1/EgtB/PvdO family nonheme iron enzyme [Alphaproteobacteria bacterium]|nr:SUMF1/EgtB/PvdO family nonheme iron enzyme [Alphaproteobacteria bacterium]